MNRMLVLSLALLAAICFARVFAVISPSAADAQPRAVAAEREYGSGLVRFRGHGPEWWAAQARQAHREAARLRHELRRRYRLSSITALRLAAITFGVRPRTLISIADCETAGSFSPYAANPYSSARGLMQFLTRGPAVAPNGEPNQRGTWGTTPYYRFSFYDPHASALAAAWMIRQGRLSEWSCA